MTEMQSENAQDALLGQIVDEYLAALAEGKYPDINTYAARYPELADMLRVAIPAILATAAQGPKEPIRSEHNEQRVGDFRIIRQIGRGGMGIVYEAEQISMARKVALKVLPFAGLVDDVKIARFQNEVRAVAALDHPNIVSVYMVGNERGVHYFAMQLIRGQNLAQVIDSLRDSMSNGKAIGGGAISETLAGASRVFQDDPTTAAEPETKTSLPQIDTVQNYHDSTISHDSQSEYFRNVATLGIQAAKALQHAHDQGIIHRDIKPANLLLDRNANLYLTDFGLARIEADAGVTMTGDLIGTLRYMAPEQALAKRVEIDHRADIYSLAVTLFELLTLRPAFDATDRQELLKQIAFNEPVSLRQLNSDIPIDLETIIGKAMSKDMVDRYDTSEQLGDDLRRFLDHRPIYAKPPTIGQRAAKWTRRNTRFVWTVIASLCLVTFAFGVSTLLVAKQRDEAFANADAAKASLYVSEMNQAYQAWNRGNAPRTQELLANQLPAAGSPDRRGIEWYYLASRCKANRGQELLKPDKTFSLSPDGTTIGAVSDGDLVLLNLETNERDVLIKDISKLTEWTDERDWTDECDISASGKRIGVATNDGIRIVDVESKESTFVSSDDGIALNSSPVRFSPNEEWGAHFDREGATHLWDAETGRIKWSKPIGEKGGEPVAVRFSPSSEVLVTLFKRPSYAVVFKVSDGSHRSISFEQEVMRDFAFIGEESIVVTGGGVFGAMHVDLSKDGAAAKEPLWLPPTRYVSALHLSSDKSRIALGTEGNAVEVWNLQTRQLLWRQLRNRTIEYVRFLGNNRLLIGSDGAVETCNLRDDSVTRLFAETRYHWTNCLHQHGKEIVFAGPSHQLIFWNPSTEQSREIDFKEYIPIESRNDVQVLNVASTRDRSLVAATCGFDGKSSQQVRMWNEDDELAHQFPADGIYSMAFSSDGRWLGLGDYGVTIVDSKTNAIHWESPERPGTGALSFSPDGKWLAAGAGNWRKNGVLSLWRIDGDAFRLKKEFEHREMILCSRISADSRWLVAGDWSGRIVVYDLSRAAVYETIDAHPMAVQSFDFSPDGKCLVSGSYDGSIKFWQVGSWKELGEVSHNHAVQGLRFYSSESELGLLVGRRTASSFPAEQEVHWIEKEIDWSWLR